MKLRLLLVLMTIISCASGRTALISTDAPDQEPSDSSHSKLELSRVSRNRSNQHNHILTNQSIRRAQTMQGSVTSSILRGPAAARDKASRPNTAASAGLGSTRHHGPNPPIVGGPVSGTSGASSISGTSFKRTEVLGR